MSRWQELTGGGQGQDYATRLAGLAATGKDMHGEADAVTRLAPDRARVLDAGCGTGRVAIELDRRGFEVVGLDLDDSMLTVARRQAPELAWITGDLADPGLVAAHGVLEQGNFDVVVAAGNVIPLLADGTGASAVANLATLLTSTGHLIVGFGLDPAHLPLDEAPVTLDDYDTWCDAEGLMLVERLATWDGQAFDDPDADNGYAVSIHRPARALTDTKRREG